jgi:hypothetical protein
MGDKKYEYKVYSDNRYITSFKNVISDFTYNETINTVGSQLNITLGYSFDDLESTIDSDLLFTGTDYITTENADNVVTRLSYEYDVPLNLGYEVKVIEFSDLYPNGLTVFNGKIVKWSSELESNTTQVTLFSYGYELSQYIISLSGDLSLEQDSSDSSYELNPTSGKTAGNAVAQVFSPTVDTTIGSISVAVSVGNESKLSPARLKLYEGTPDNAGSLLSTVVKADIQGTTEHLEEFSFGSPIDIVSTSDYFFMIEFNGSDTSSYSPVTVYYNSTSVYADGAIWFADPYTTLANFSETATADIRFTVNASQGSVLYSFSALDTGEGVRQAMDIYNSQGGSISYTDTTVETTGTNMYYSFNIASTKDIIDKALSVSPATFYYYVDVATNTLYFKDRSVTPDHVLKNKYDVGNLSIEQNIDEMQNTVYFSGGDVAGENLLVTGQNTASVNSYGRWKIGRASCRERVLR